MIVLRGSLVLAQRPPGSMATVSFEQAPESGVSGVQAFGGMTTGQPSGTPLEPHHRGGATPAPLHHHYPHTPSSHAPHHRHHPEAAPPAPAPDHTPHPGRHPGSDATPSISSPSATPHVSRNTFPKHGRHETMGPHLPGPAGSVDPNAPRARHPAGGATPGSHTPASQSPNAQKTSGRGEHHDGSDPRGMRGYIRQQAARNGIDPNVAVRVAEHEGLREFLGDKGTSGGAFQLHTGGGLGDDFRKETGKDPLDPKNERASIAWAMKHAGKTKSWAPFHGAASAGVGEQEGFGYEGGVPAADRHEAQKALLGRGTPAGSTGGATPKEGSELAATPGRHPDVANVDPRLREILGAAGSYLPPGYRATINEGYNADPRTHVGHSQHHIKGRGALDVQITDPSGHRIPNEGNDPTGMYHRLARGAYTEMLKRHPELNGRLAWGGAFGASHHNRARDLMHFDLGGERGSYKENRLSNMGALPSPSPPNAPGGTTPAARRLGDARIRLARRGTPPYGGGQ